ncbi:MAG: PilZ domain-containing protein [Thermoanaerobaculia bacterium]|nr:PilZ domain-containing protein [Thermoanaerobaculia bacterium]
MSEHDAKEREGYARRGKRRPIAGVLVAIDAPEVAERPWVVDAIDVSADGMGLVLPPELPEGTRVELSFKLDAAEFARLPATVTHRMGTSGGVRFDPWPDADRLRFLEFLVGCTKPRIEPGVIRRSARAAGEPFGDTER